LGATAAIDGTYFEDEALLHPAAVVGFDPVVEASEDVSDRTRVSRQRDGTAPPVGEKELMCRRHRFLTTLGRLV
jgi:hypothetical protein